MLQIYISIEELLKKPYQISVYKKILKFPRYFWVRIIKRYLGFCSLECMDCRGHYNPCSDSTKNLTRLGK